MTTSLVVLVVVLGAALASMPVFALLRRAPDPDAVKKGSSFLLGIGNFLVHWLMWAIEVWSGHAFMSPVRIRFSGCEPDHHVTSLACVRRSAAS